MSDNPSANPEVFRLNVEYYKKSAKALLKEVKSGDRAARARLTRHAGKSGTTALHQAQLAIAREQGFVSWPRFRAFLAESQLDFQGLVTEFLKAATTDLKRAAEVLERHPHIARAGLYPALVLGITPRVERILDASPSLATTKGGPLDREPLLYVCFSRFVRRREHLVETARVVLRHSADPNASYIDDRFPDSPLSCLYGASGLNNNPALAEVLLDAGARTDDGESVYHSTEHPDLACLRLLLARGASPERTNALKHMLDREDPTGVRLLLDAGFDPNELNHRGETALHWAVWRGRGVQIIEALLDAGATIDAKRADGRTAYTIAALSGQSDTAKLLESRGANAELSELDTFIAQCAREDHASLPEVSLPPEYHHFLPEFASNHRIAAVRTLLAGGVPIDSRGEHGGTALHWACWKGYADLVKILLDHGASTTIEDNAFHAPPTGWFAHGQENCGEGDYPAVARLLRERGLID